jgi:hypothetical protein
VDLYTLLAPWQAYWSESLFNVCVLEPTGGLTLLVIQHTHSVPMKRGEGAVTWPC